MSTHPNVILLCTLKPDDLARRTYRSILEASGVEDGEAVQVTIGGSKYYIKVMETHHDDDMQIDSDEGDIIVHDFLTYGYCEKMEWSKVEAQKAELEAWAREICEKFACSYKIWITANYW